MRTILYIGFPNADNNVVLRFATRLAAAFWLILGVSDGPITMLISDSKIQGFSKLLHKIQGDQVLN